MEAIQSQTIIVNRSFADNSLQIVIPPFRPIHFYELEDDFETVLSEIRTTIQDEATAVIISGFVTAFRDSILKEDVTPIIEFFLADHQAHMNPSDIRAMHEGIQEFITMIQNEDRLMH